MAETTASPSKKQDPRHESRAKTMQSLTVVFEAVLQMQREQDQVVRR
jgi:hypothetical protein